MPAKKGPNGTGSTPQLLWHHANYNETREKSTDSPRLRTARRVPPEKAGSIKKPYPKGSKLSHRERRMIYSASDIFNTKKNRGSNVYKPAEQQARFQEILDNGILEFSPANLEVPPAKDLRVTHMRGHERLLGDPTPVEEDHIRYTKAVKDEKLPNEFWKVSTAAPWNFPGVEKYRGRQWEGNLRMDAHSRGKFERSSELFGQGRLYSTETDEMRKARDDLMPQQRFLDEDSIQGIYSKGPHLPSEGKVFVQTSKSDPPPVNSFAPPPTDLKEVPVDAVTEHNYPTAPLPPPNTRQKTHLASPVGGSALEPTDLSRMPAVPLPTVGCLPEERSPKPLPYVPRVYVEKDGTGPGQMSRERKDIELRQSPHSGGLPRTDPPPQPGLTVEEKERRVMEEVRLRTEKNFSQILGLEQPARSVLTAEDRRELLSGLVDHLDAKGEGAARRAGIHDGEKEKKQASVKTANISRERVTKEDAQARRQAFLSSDLFGRQTARPGRPLPPPSSDFTLYGFEPLDTGLELQRRLVTRNGKPSHKAASQRKKEELHSSSVFDKDPPFVPPPSEPPRKRAIPPPYQPPPRENPQGLPYTHGFYQGFPASAREMKIAHLQSSIFN